MPALALSRNGFKTATEFPEAFRAAPVSCLRGLPGGHTGWTLDKLHAVGVDFRPYGPRWGWDVGTLTHDVACEVLDYYAEDLREALACKDGPLLGAALLRAWVGAEPSRPATAQHLLRLVSLQELGSPEGALGLLTNAAWYDDRALCMQIAAENYRSDEDIITHVNALDPDNNGRGLAGYGERLVLHAKACRSRSRLQRTSAQPA